LSGEHAAHTELPRPNQQSHCLQVTDPALPAPLHVPPQADAFTFRLPNLGALSELRVGHDGRRDWHLERVDVEDTTSGTTYFFPCSRWVPPGGNMSRALQLRGYTTDPGSLPVQYRVEMDVEAANGAVPPPDGLRLTLFGARGETEAQHVDASAASPGRTLTAWFDAENVGAMERLRVGLAPTQDGELGRGVWLRGGLLVDGAAPRCAALCPTLLTPAATVCSLLLALHS